MFVIDNKLILVADFETYLKNDDNTGEVYHEIFIFGLYNGTFMDIVSLDEENKKLNIFNFLFNFLDCINSKHNIIFVYFHNLSSFDGFIIMHELFNNNMSFKHIIRDDKIYEICVYINDLKIIFRDSYLLCPLSLESAALCFNNLYFKKKFSFNDLSINKLISQKEDLLNYLRNDLFTFFEFLINFNNFLISDFNFNICDILTLSSLTQIFFLKYYFFYEFISLSYNQDLFIRDSYKGGIVDIYKPFVKNAIYLDVNSMYPYIMSSNVFGYGTPFYLNNLCNYDFDLYLFTLKYKSFIKVKVLCKNLIKPLIVLKINNKNIQPNGIFITTVYSEEIKYCIENYPENYCFIFIEAYYYKQTGFIFKNFVLDFYNKRMFYRNNNNIYFENFIKIMMNSLYGRFGLKQELQKAYFVTEDNFKYFLESFDSDISLISKYKNLYKIIIENIEKESDLFLKQFKSRIDWASAITSLARIFMQNLKDNLNVYYTDIDSIVIEKKDLIKIKHLIGNNLGQLKIIHHWDEVIFIAPKMYVYKINEKYYFSNNSIDSSLIISDKIYNIYKRILYLKNVENILFFNKNLIYKNLNHYKLYQKNFDIKIYYFNYDKRKKIYKNLKWVDTKPLFIKS